MREVLLAGEEAEEGATLEGGVVPDGAAEVGVTGFEGVEGLTKGDGGWDFELDFVGSGLGEGAQMRGELDADHARVWTSTERTAGRSRTMADQESPEFGEA